MERERETTGIRRRNKQRTRKEETKRMNDPTEKNATREREIESKRGEKGGGLTINREEGCE